MQTETLSTDLTGGAPVIAPTAVPSLAALIRSRPKSRSLANRTMEGLLATFAERNHCPSDDMWTALRAVAETLEAMADGDAEPVIYLSSLDPGVGKTQTYIHFIRELLAHPDYRDVAILVCVRRKDQIVDVVNDAGLHCDDFAVLTADAELNTMGNTIPHCARVLFTTHRMIESRCHAGNAFEDVAAFHYRGKPRAVRIWDEAILPGQTLTVSRYAVGRLFDPLQRTYPKLTDDLETLFNNLKKIKDGTIIALPDFVEDHGVTLNDAMALVANETESTKVAVECLWFLSGRAVTVRRDGELGNTVLDYRDTLPADLMPLLVLDASIRVRSIYGLWEDGRGGIIRLPEATKRYDNLTLHVWRQAGSKTAFRSKRSAKLIEGVASTILTKPDEQWLIVHHKAESIGIDFETEVRQLLPDGGRFPPDDKGKVHNRVHFLNWGAHDATNAFSHVPNVILAGTLFHRGSYYEALGRVAAGKPSATGPFPKSDTQRVMDGENRHLILQAACRGAVRLSDGDQCRPANVYIIASRSKNNIERDLPEVFPGARIVRWQPVKKALRGKVAEAFEYVRTRIEQAPDAKVPYKEAMAAIGWSDAKNFKRRIREHEDFIEALEAEGIEDYGRGYRKAVGSPFAE